MHQGKNYTSSNAQEDHAYPFAGESNAKVRLGVVPSIGGEITWMNIFVVSRMNPAAMRNILLELTGCIILLLQFRFLIEPIPN
jgi:hypothetical protein